MNDNAAAPPQGGAFELSGLDERSLVLRAQDGDVEAFERLVGLHQGRLFLIAFLVLNDRLDAEDVVQESLLLAWKRLHLLEKPESFRSWISQICANRATDLGRQLARRSTSTTFTGELPPPPPANGASASDCGSSVAVGVTADPQQEAVTNEQLRSLADVLAGIPPRPSRLLGAPRG